MHSLFWKMFIGAWATAMVMVVAAIYITQFREFGDPGHEGHGGEQVLIREEEREGKRVLIRRERRWEGPVLFHEVVRNLRVARRHGPGSFRRWLEEQPQEVQNKVYALDQHDRELLGRPLPRDMAPAFEKLNYRDREVHQLVKKKPAVGFFLPLRGPDNLRVLIVAGQSKETLLLRFLWRNFWPMLLLSMLASGAACYWLARYLSPPGGPAAPPPPTGWPPENWTTAVTPGLRRRNDELADLARDFDSMTAQLQASMSEQRRLIKDVSHELRSPLTRLQIALGIARQKNVRALDAELDKIGKAADYLEDIVAEVLSLPVTGPDRRPLDDVVEINGLIEALLEDLGEEAREKNLRFAKIASGGELLVATRGSSLTAALENILRNAIKYSPANGSVTIEIKEVAKTCRIHVIDSGSGVPEGELEAIFRPFYRTDGARTRESGGFGLGLAIAQRTILHHGGGVKASNMPGAGLCVEVRLPLLEINDQ